MGIRYSKPPVLMHDVIGDLDAVERLLESQAPYAPLGGWFRPGADPHARTRPMWFQKDWVHDVFAAEGSDLFLRHERLHRGGEGASTAPRWSSPRAST